MTSQLTEDFLVCFRHLPEEVRTLARKNYQLWKQNPLHPSLSFKRIHGEDPLYSVRVGIVWRALGLLENDVITWFWIGSHADYDRLVRQWT